MGKSQRNKGHQWQRDLVKLFRKAMPGANVFRGFQSRGGSEAADVVCPHFWVEAKVGKKPPIRQALDQAARDMAAGRAPVAVLKEDYRRPFVVLYLDDFLEIVSGWWENEQVNRMVGDE